MKNKVGKVLSVILAAALTGGALSACGDSTSIDGSATAIVINGEEIPYGEINFYIRYQQAEIYYYMESFGLSSSSLWSSDYTYTVEETSESSDTSETSESSDTSETSGTSEDSSSTSSESSSEDEAEEITTTYGEYFKETAIEVFTQLVVTRQKAIDEYGLELSEEDYEDIEEAVAEFMEANSDAEEIYGITTEMLEDLLELYAYEVALEPYATEDVDKEVSDEEAAQTTIIYVRIAKNDDSEEEEALESGETKTNAELAEDAEEVLELLLEEEDFDADEANDIADSVNEDFFAMEYSFSTYDNDTFPDEVDEVFDTLEDGEVYGEVIDTDDYYYIIKMVAFFDEEETEEEREYIISQRVSEAYTALKEEWAEEATVERMECLEELTLDDRHVYSMTTSTTSDTDDSSETSTESDTDDSSETSTESDTDDSSETNTESDTDDSSETSTESDTEDSSGTSTESDTETSSETSSSS